MKATVTVFDTNGEPRRHSGEVRTTNATVTVLDVEYPWHRVHSIQWERTAVAKPFTGGVVHECEPEVDAMWMVDFEPLPEERADPTFDAMPFHDSPEYDDWHRRMAERTCKEFGLEDA